MHDYVEGKWEVATLALAASRLAAVVFVAGLVLRGFGVLQAVRRMVHWARVATAVGGVLQGVRRRKRRGMRDADLKPARKLQSQQDEQNTR
jgi:hypothetical protein